MCLSQATMLTQGTLAKMLIRLLLNQKNCSSFLVPGTWTYMTGVH